MIQFVSIKAELNRNKSKCRKFQDVLEVIEMNTLLCSLPIDAVFFL